MAGKPKDARQPYSVEQVDRIVTAVGLPVNAAKRDYLHRKLNTAVSDYLSSRDYPTPAKVRDRLAAIEKATQKLLSTLGNVKETGLPTPSVMALDMPATVAGRLDLAADDELSEEGQSITHSGSARVTEAMRGVLSLQRWATRALAEAKEQVKPRGKTQDEDRLLLAGALACIYRVTFEQEPGVSRHPENWKPRGPFIRFVNTCLKEVGKERSLESVAELAKLGKNWDFYEHYGIIRIEEGFGGRVLYSRDTSK